MKKTVLLLILIIVSAVSTACDGTISTTGVDTTTSSRTDEADTTATSKTERTADTTASAEEPSFAELSGMPAPLDNSSREGHGDYFRLCGNDKFNNMPGSFLDKYAEYLGERADLDWGENADTLISRGTSITTYQSFYSVAVANKIPMEIVMEAIDEYNEYFVALIERNEADGFLPSDDSYSILYTEEDKAALLTQDVERILAHFASEYTIVIGDKAYTPAWLYYSSFEDYEKAGISAEMILEKVSALSKIDFTDEAVKAFELKLSEFTGGYVSFDR